MKYEVIVMNDRVFLHTAEVDAQGFEDAMRKGFADFVGNMNSGPAFNEIRVRRIEGDSK